MRVNTRLSSSDIVQQPASARMPRGLVVERYLKNLIEKPPATVCLKSSNFCELGLILMDQMTYLFLGALCYYISATICDLVHRN